MAAFGNIVVADALGSPINHTFVPASKSAEGLFEWQDQTSASNPSGVPVGFGTITCLAQMSKNVDKGQGNFVLNYRMQLPVLESISNSTVSGILPAPQLGYTCTMHIKFAVSSRCSTQNRADLYKMGVLGFQNAQVGDWAKSYLMPTG